MHRRIYVDARNLLKPAVSRDTVKNHRCSSWFLPCNVSSWRHQICNLRIMRGSRENGISSERIRRKFTCERNFLTVLIDRSYIFSSSFLLSYHHITSDWFMRYWPPSISRVDIRNDYCVREKKSTRGQFFLVLCLLSHRRNIIERFILSTCKNLQLGREFNSRFYPRRDNHLLVNVVCEFLSSCKNVPSGGKAWTFAC